MLRWEIAVTLSLNLNTTKLSIISETTKFIFN